jgi:methionine-rich copper-binding protein CopC
MSAGRIGVLVVIAALVVLGCLPAAAVPPVTHARLNGSTPAPGALLPQAPAAVALDFNRDIAPPASVAVTSPSGRRVGAGDPVVQGRVVTAPVAPREEGTYTVGYRAVSVDGHPITGRFTFSVGHRGPAYDPRATRAERRPGWLVTAVVGGSGAAVLLGLWLRRRVRERRR